MEGAIRECEEEAGVLIEIKGIIDYMENGGGKWKRVTYYAEPKY
jgi:8-oxo-dGTP pyrophosphatase MutT (NUDIX family)